MNFKQILDKTNKVIDQMNLTQREKDLIRYGYSLAVINIHESQIEEIKQEINK